MTRKFFALAAMLVTLIISAAAFASYERTASVTIPAYTDPELNNRNGNERVDAGDRLIVFEERGKAFYVRYPTSSGTKDRWVSRGVFTETISDGWYRIKPMHDPGHSADALGVQYRDGNNIHLWENIDCDQQKFYLQNRGNGYFSLQSAYGNRLFVTADGDGNGANLYTSNWNGFDSQLFRLVNGGNNSFHIFAKSGNAMNFDCSGAGSGNGTNLQLWNSEDVSWQKWTLEPVNGPAGGGNSDIGNSKLQELINRWDGRRWTDGYSRSGNAEKYLQSSAIQCKEFASYIFNILYDTGYIGSGSTSSNYYNWRLNGTPARVYQVAEVPQTNNAYQAMEAFRNLFAQAQPGDFIQIKRGSGGAHSAIFVRRVDNGIQWLDANADGANSIKLQTYSYGDLVKTTSRGYQWNVAMSLYRAR